MTKSKDENNFSPFIPIIAGGTSGVISRFLTHPLDVVKIRFQLQVEPISKSSLESKYVSLPQALRVILREEGLLAFWKGHVPAQALSLVYGVVQFGLYETLVRQANMVPGLAKNKVEVEFLSGFTAGCVATLVSFPFDIVRTRLIAQGNQKVYSSTKSALKQILDKEGFRGWFKGLTPTLIQMGPVTGLNFAMFNFLKRLFEGSQFHLYLPEDLHFSDNKERTHIRFIQRSGSESCKIYHRLFSDLHNLRKNLQDVERYLHESVLVKRLLQTCCEVNQQLLLCDKCVLDVLTDKY